MLLQHQEQRSSLWICYRQTACRHGRSWIRSHPIIATRNGNWPQSSEFFVCERQSRLKGSQRSTLNTFVFICQATLQTAMQLAFDPTVIVLRSTVYVQSIQNLGRKCMCHTFDPSSLFDKVLLRKKTNTNIEEMFFTSNRTNKDASLFNAILAQRGKHMQNCIAENRLTQYCQLYKRVLWHYVLWWCLACCWASTK